MCIDGGRRVDQEGVRAAGARQKTSRKAEEDLEERGGGKFESVASEGVRRLEPRPVENCYQRRPV